MSHSLQLIVGLGNPGATYSSTRHNAGVWLLEQFANQCEISLHTEKKFFGLASKIQVSGKVINLLAPTTFMNNSGKSINAVRQFYQIPLDHILVVHDELDLPCGSARFKWGGGDGGHNGLKNSIQQLGSNAFWRLRIGIGRPTTPQKIEDYVLSSPSSTELTLIYESIKQALLVLPRFIIDQSQNAVTQLHTITNSNEKGKK